MSELKRYSKITTVMPREFVLLVGTGCRWGKCTFCDYYFDKSINPIEINRKVLSHVTGEFGVLDVIDSGSCFELDEATFKLLKEICDTKGIHTIWFETHYMYRNYLDKLRAYFSNQTLYFRCGAETFDVKMRKKWNKGIKDEVDAKKMAEDFNGICLLVGVEGQTKEQILNDLALAKKYFDYYSVNLFCNNSTSVKRDEALAKWFIEEVAPTLEGLKGCEVLIDNTDLGVG